MVTGLRQPERFGARIRRILREEGEDAAIKAMRKGFTPEEDRLFKFGLSQRARQRFQWARSRERDD